MIDDQNEDFDQKRFITAMVISGLVLIGWQTFFAPDIPPPQPTQTNNELVKEEKSTSPKEAVPVAKLEKEKPEEAPKAKTFPREKHTLALNGSHVTVTSHNATLVSATIDEPEQYEAAGDLLEGLAEDAKYKPFGVHFDEDTIPVAQDVEWEVLKETMVKNDAGELTEIAFRYHDPNDRFTLTKSFKPGDLQYSLDVEVEVHNKLTDAKLSGEPVLTMAGYQDPEKESSWFDFRPDEWETLCKTEDDMDRALGQQLKKESEIIEGKLLWGGVNLRYTAITAVLGEPGNKGCVMAMEDNLVYTTLPGAKIDVAPGEKTSFSYKSFVGPKDYDVLSEFGNKMEESVDYGLLTFICRPMRWALIQCYKITNNWGWAILLLTVIIRAFLWPINQKVYANSERMKDIQPKMQEIREKHKNDQQRMSEETMKLMKENNVSMLGCAPMLLQMPVLLAFYWTILYSAELYQADWAFYYTDLSAPDPYYVLPIAMAVVMFFQQRLMPTPEGPQAKQMQTMMKIMPVMMAVFMLFLPSGVVLYYFLSLLIGVIQQVIIKKKYREQREATA